MSTGPDKDNKNSKGALNTIEIELVKTFFNDNHKMQLLGEIFSKQNGRDIVQLLIREPMYPNELVTKLDIGSSLVYHYLNKLKELNLLIPTQEIITKKGKEHTLYQMYPVLVITPGYTEETVKKEKIFSKIFKNSVRFASVVFMGMASWAMVNLSVKSWNEPLKFLSDTGEPIFFKHTEGKEGVEKLFLDNIFELFTTVDSLEVLIPVATNVVSITVVILMMLVIFKKKSIWKRIKRIRKKKKEE